MTPLTQHDLIEFFHNLAVGQHLVPRLGGRSGHGVAGVCLELKLQTLGLLDCCTRRGPTTPSQISRERVKRRPVLGGLINEYERAA